MTDPDKKEEPMVENDQEDDVLQEQSSPKELKVVILINGEKVICGVQSPNCDPVYDTMDGNLDIALVSIPELVDRAKKSWAKTPLNPKADLPEPPPAPAVTRNANAGTAVNNPGRKTKATGAQQPSLF